VVDRPPAETPPEVDEVAVEPDVLVEDEWVEDDTAEEEWEEEPLVETVIEEPERGVQAKRTLDPSWLAQPNDSNALEGQLVQCESVQE